MRLSKAELATLSDSVNRALSEDRETGSPGGYRRHGNAVWAALAELGVFATLATEEQGGLELGWETMRAILYPFGTTISTQPYLATAILGGGVLRHAGDGINADIACGNVDFHVLRFG